MTLDLILDADCSGHRECLCCDAGSVPQTEKAIRYRDGQIPVGFPCGAVDDVIPQITNYVLSHR